MSILSKVSSLRGTTSAKPGLGYARPNEGLGLIVGIESVDDLKPQHSKMRHDERRIEQRINTKWNFPAICKGAKLLVNQNISRPTLGSAIRPRNPIIGVWDRAN